VVVRARFQKPKKTSEGYIQRKQLNTGCHIFSVFSERLMGDPREAGQAAAVVDAANGDMV
jgi:hypothetical protein